MTVIVSIKRIQTLEVPMSFFHPLLEFITDIQASCVKSVGDFDVVYSDHSSYTLEGDLEGIKHDVLAGSDWRLESWCVIQPMLTRSWTTVQLPASLCSKAGNSDSDVDSPITQAFRDGCFTIPWLEALHGWRLVPKPALSKPQAEGHYKLSGVSRSWPTFTITVSASPAFHVAQWMLRVLYLQHSKRTAPNWFCSPIELCQIGSRLEPPFPFSTPRLFVGRSNTAQSEDIQIVAHRFLQCHRRGCALEWTTHFMCYDDLGVNFNKIYLQAFCYT